MPESAGLADFVLPLIRRRRLVVGIVGAAAVVSVVAALLWPKSWRATATLLPPERRMDTPLFVPGGFEAVGSTLRGLTLRQVATPTDVFLAILESRSVAEAIVERFDLREEYDVKSLLKAVHTFQEHMDVGTTNDGTIRVSAVASSPEQAADLANALVEELDRVNRSLATREATAIREFVERELDQSKTRLAAAEDSLRAFQEAYGALDIGEQAKAVIAAAASIRAKILSAEVELGVLRRTRDASHPDVQRAEDLLDELRLRLAEIEGDPEPPAPAVEGAAPPAGDGGDGAGAGDGADDGAGDAAGGAAVTREVFPPLSDVPALGLRYGRLLRGVKTEEAVVTLLTEQYHRARIEERRSLPTVRVLDAAFPPEHRYRPRRTAMVLVSVAAALVLSILLAYSLEIVGRVRSDPERYAGLHRIADDVRKGIRS